MLVTPKQLLKDIISGGGMPCDHKAMATKNFSWQELLINQKETPSIAVLLNLLVIAKTLQVYRDKVFKCPIKITSGWRSEHYNHKIGGASKSLHCLGLAIDFIPFNYTAVQGYEILDKLHKGGLERTNGDWIHIDARCQVVRFDNKNVILASHFDIKAHDKLMKEGKQ
jgi:hypothetical protein